MRPYLRQGVPIRPPGSAKAILQYLCECPTCVQHIAWDPIVMAPVPGTLLGREEYYKHQRNRRLSPSPAPAIVEPPQAVSTTPSTENVGLDTLTEETISYSRIRSTNDAADSYFLDSLINDLAEFKARFSAAAWDSVVFLHPPLPSTTKIPEISEEGLYPNGGPYAIDFGRTANRFVAEYETRLVAAEQKIDNVLAKQRPVLIEKAGSLKSNVRAELQLIALKKREEWERRYELLRRARRAWRNRSIDVVDTSTSTLFVSLDLSVQHFSSAKHFVGPLCCENDLVFTVYIIAAVLHILCHVSIDHCAFLLRGIQILLQQMVCSDGSSTSALMRDIPSDVRIIVDRLDLSAEAKGYCCCPKCFCCYSLDNYPAHCTNKAEVDSTECGRSLRREFFRRGQLRTYPARRYLYHDFKAWVGELLCRPGMEEYLDRDVYNTGSNTGEQRDIWDGRALRTFTWTDGNLFAGEKDHKEGRYVFALNMDGFNPFGNKVAGKTGGVGAMYMVCLNLPPHLRYRVENIFLVSIIPGPHHPSLTQINHLLRPLVDDLVTFWHKGVYYSRTPKCPKGRLVRCALVPVVCDLPAAQQMMAFASHSSNHFCCYCGLHRTDMENLNMAEWPKGVTREEYVARAEEWKAATAKEQKKLFEAHGIRYSELLRLPYWNPTAYVVIDTMHSIFLAALRHHCRVLWGMDINVEDGDGSKPAKKNVPAGPTEDEVALGWDILRRGTDAELGKLLLPVLREVCNQANVLNKGTKKDLLKRLKAHVCAFSTLLMKQPSADHSHRDRRWVGSTHRAFPQILDARSQNGMIPSMPKNSRKQKQS